MPSTKYFDYFTLFSYCGLIYWLSDQQSLPSPELFVNEDKLHHFLAYFGVGILVWRALEHILSRNYILFAVSGIFCILFGISDEWHQSFVAGRDANIMDWLADSIGGLVGTLSCYCYKTSIPKFSVFKLKF